MTAEAAFSRATRRSRSYGVRPWGDGNDSTADVEAIKLLRPVRYFIKLLEGTLGPGENDARYPADG